MKNPYELAENILEQTTDGTKIQGASDVLEINYCKKSRKAEKQLFKEKGKLDNQKEVEKL